MNLAKDEYADDDKLDITRNEIARTSPFDEVLSRPIVILSSFGPL